VAVRERQVDIRGTALHLGGIAGDGSPGHALGNNPENVWCM
jgi:hypothetical protein